MTDVKKLCEKKSVPTVADEGRRRALARLGLAAAAAYGVPTLLPLTPARASSGGSGGGSGGGNSGGGSSSNSGGASSSESGGATTPTQPTTQTSPTTPTTPSDSSDSGTTTILPLA